MDLKDSLEKIGLDAAQIYQVMPSAIFTVDKNRNITSWNRRATEITGYTLAEVLGKPCTLLLSEHCAFACGLFSPETTKPILNRECWITTKNGELRYVSKNADVLKNEQGEIVGGVECFVDITERKQAEEVLRKQAEIVNSIDHPLYVVDKDLTYLFGNKNYLQRMNLRTSAELIGKNYQDFHKEEQCTDFAQKIANIFKTGQSMRYYYVSLRHDGRRFLRTLSPHVDGNGQVIAVSISSKEVSSEPSEAPETEKIVTICAYCNKIANETGQWVGMMEYFGHRLDIDYSHGMCPSCSENVYKQFGLNRKKGQKQ